MQLAAHDQRPLIAQEAGKAATIADGRSGAHAVLVYRESATYVCGIGQLHSTRGYFFKEQDR